MSCFYWLGRDPWWSNTATITDYLNVKSPKSCFDIFAKIMWLGPTYVFLFVGLGRVGGGVRSFASSLGRAFAICYLLLSVGCGYFFQGSLISCILQKKREFARFPSSCLVSNSASPDWHQSRGVCREIADSNFLWWLSYLDNFDRLL